MAGQGERELSNIESAGEFIPDLQKMQKIPSESTLGTSTSSGSYNLESFSSSMSSSPPSNVEKSVSGFDSVRESHHGEASEKKVGSAMNQVADIFEYLLESNKQPPSPTPVQCNQTEEIVGTSEESCVYEITRRKMVTETVKIYKKCSEESVGKQCIEDDAANVVAEVDKNVSWNIISKRLVKSCNNICGNSANKNLQENIECHPVSNTSPIPSGAPSTVYSFQEAEGTKLVQNGIDGYIGYSEEGGAVFFPSLPQRSFEELSGRPDGYNEVADYAYSDVSGDPWMKTSQSDEYIDVTQDDVAKGDVASPSEAEVPRTAEVAESVNETKLGQLCIDIINEFVATQKNQRSCGGWCNLSREERDECLRLIVRMRALNNDVVFVDETYPNKEQLKELRRKRKIDDREEHQMTNEEPSEKRIAVAESDEDVNPDNKYDETEDGLNNTEI